MESSFDINRALTYISTLLQPEISLPINANDLPGEKIQPTIGPLAAALLNVLVSAKQPAHILDIGTSYGYSAAVLGRAASAYDGHVTSIEINPRLAEAAQKNIAALGLSGSVSILTADARAAVHDLTTPFGLILQDGHKLDYLPMLDDLVARLENGGLLISDDVLFPVMNIPDSAREWQTAMEVYNRALAARQNLQTVWLPIGDGVAVSVHRIRHG